MLSILVAVDENVERASTQADALERMAEECDDLTAHVLHVFSDNPEGASVHQVDAVREVRDRLEDAGVDVELVETGGDPVEGILDRAESYGVDQICLGGRKRSPAGKALFGSVAQQVLLNTDTPVLVCGRQSE